MNLSRAARARALVRGRHYAIADDIHALSVPLLVLFEVSIWVARAVERGRVSDAAAASEA